MTDVVARELCAVSPDLRTFMPGLIELHRQGRLPMERLATCFSFAETNNAVQASLDGRVVKPLLEMG